MNEVHGKDIVKQPVRQRSTVLSVSDLLNAATTEYCGKHLETAKRLCLEILAIDVHHADALNLLGLIAHQSGAYEVALKMIGRALSIRAAEPAFHCNLGLVLLGAGKPGEAAAACEKAIRLRPEFAEAWLNLGNACQAQGKLQKAANCLERSLEIDPNCAQAFNSLGSVLLNQGKPERARAKFEAAVSLAPDFADAYSNLGATLMKLNDDEGARKALAHALQVDPSCASALHNMGNLLRSEGKLEAARTLLERAVSMGSDRLYAYSLGTLLEEQCDLDGALKWLMHAIRLDQSFAPAYKDCGVVLKELGRPHEAVRFYERAAALDPAFADAECGVATTQLLLGNFESGWIHYESRWKTRDGQAKPHIYGQPRWAGGMQPGKVLLWGEQGIGDEIMFAGLIPDAMRTGNRIVLDCAPRLVPLFARSFPGTEVFSTDISPLSQSAQREIAAQLPTGSLPRLFRAAETSFLASTSPYLKADAALREVFRSRYAGERKVIGIAWHTNSKALGKRRSIKLPAFAPLFAQREIQWVSLQYGDADELEKQVSDAHAPILVDRTVDQLKDMDSFAAQVASLDLVITIDNATAHLAGALGVPTWVLLPVAPDWRWLLDREDSPWYPSLRLFRQAKLGTWEDAIERVRTELNSMMSARARP